MHTKKIFLILLAFTLLACAFVGMSSAAESTVVLQGEEYTLKGAASGNPECVQWYLFGPSYFSTGTAPVENGKYEITISEEETKRVTAGEYYLVVQHPMKDKVFNVGPIMAKKEGYVIKVNNIGPYTDSFARILFYVNTRQSEDAIKTIEDAIKADNIDDVLTTTKLYITPKTTKSEVRQSEVYVGEKLTVSGVSYGHNNELVVVELTAAPGFSPVSKEGLAYETRARSASTRVGSGDAWSVNIDTTGLIPGTYWTIITVGQSAPQQSLTPVYVKEPVIATPTPKPTRVATQAPTPEPTPTPVSPGFGLLSLLGIGGALLLFRK